MFKILKTGLHMIDISLMRLLTILIRKFVLRRLRCYKVKYFKTIKTSEEANSKTKIIVSFVEQKKILMKSKILKITGNKEMLMKF